MDRDTAEALAEILRRTLSPLVQTLADLNIAIIHSCHLRGSIDVGKLQDLLDMVASDPAVDGLVRALVERVSDAMPPRPD